MYDENTMAASEYGTVIREITGPEQYNQWALCIFYGIYVKPVAWMHERQNCKYFIKI